MHNKTFFRLRLHNGSDSRAPRRRLGWIVGLILALTLTACASTQNGQALLAPPDSPVIMRFADQSYTLADFEQRLTRELGPIIENMVAQGQTREEIEQMANETNVRAAIFDRMIQDVLLLDYARRHGIGVDPAAVDAAVLSDLSPDDPPASLAERREQVARVQIILEVIARNTYADMVNLRHILVADEAAANQVLADLAAGATFEALARERSLDADTAAKGGLLGWIPPGQFPPEFDAAAFAAPLHTPTKVRTEQGWHVLEVLERQEKRPFDSFEQLRNSTGAQILYEQSFMPWYEELRRQAEQSGMLAIAPGFDPNTVALPFPTDD